MASYRAYVAIALLMTWLSCVSGVIVVQSNITECFDLGCDHNATCTVDRQPNTSDVLDECNCTAGFTGPFCKLNYIVELQTLTDNGILVETEFKFVHNITGRVNDAIVDQIYQSYDKIYESILIIPTIMKTLVTFGQDNIKKGDNYIDYVGETFVYLTSEVHSYCLTLKCAFSNSTGCIHVDTESENAIMDSETATVEILKLMLIKDRSKSRQDPPYTYANISVAVAKDKGDKLPSTIQAQYGEFLLPFWETFQETIKGKETNIVVVTYQYSPYIFANNTDAINTGIIKMAIVDKNGDDVTLPDPEDPVGLRAEARDALNTGIVWKEMEPSKTTEGAFNAILAFNYSIVGFTIDINLKSTKACVTLGKFGPQSFPTDDDFDIRVETKGKSRITMFRPDDLILTFSDQTIQIAHTYQAEGEALLNPILMVVKCEDGALSRRKRSAPSSGSTVAPVALDPHRYRIVEVDLRRFDPVTATWKVSADIKVSSGSGTNIAYESNFFGTFSADIMFVAPDTIDFETIFLNFSEKLRETPHALACIGGIFIIVIIIAIPLRRLDKGDAVLWSYLPLEDNTPGAEHKYYVAISTAIRSSKQLSSTVYMKVVGDKGETGIRQLTDGVRKNFGRGTTSHFVMRTTSQLGHLKHLVIWHNNVGPSPAWLLSKVIIGDIKHNRRYVFVCGKWLSLGGEDGKTWKKLDALDERIMDSQMLLNETSKRNMFDDHLWFSLSKRPNYSRFTRVQRLWSITALLFLSMIASAMFYNTPDAGGRVITLGPLKLSYKQFYVGFMSAAIAVIPSVIIINIFKHRRFKGEQVIKFPSKSDPNGQKGPPNGPKKKRCCCGCCLRCCSGPITLPWWTIFFGYSLILACIGSGAFFTFMYSLDWGTDLTVEWLLAFFLGTVESVFVLEPVKAIALAVLLACCCSRNARQTLADLPLPSEEDEQEVEEIDLERSVVVVDPTVICPADIGDDSSLETKRLKKRLQLDKKLYALIKHWVVQFLYVILVATICSQNVVEEAYYQNKHLKAMLYTATPNVTDDIWNWISDRFIIKMFPKLYLNNEVRMSYVLRFIDDTQHFRLGLARIRQVRVTPRSEPFVIPWFDTQPCFVPSVLANQVTRCPVSYDADTEAKDDYCKGWAPTNTTCFDENEDTDYAFLYSGENKTEALTYHGTFATYKGGGYFHDIGPKRSLAEHDIELLRNNSWIDEYTRAIFVEAMLYNPDSKLFSHVKVIFELSSYGERSVVFKITTANLYPFQQSFDYVVLGFQVLFILIIFVKFVLIFVRAIKSRCGYFLSVSCWISILEVGFGICAIVFFCVRVDETITAIEKIFKNLGSFVSFEQVNLMDEWYRATVSAVCFIATLELLEPLSFNYYMHLMRTTIIISRHKLAGFMFILINLILAFSMLIYLMYGNVEEKFYSVGASVLSLFQVTIGMVSFRQNINVEDVGIICIFGIFTIMITLITINLFISTLNMAFSDATDLINRQGEYQFDKRLNGHFWNKFDTIAQLLHISKVHPVSNSGGKEGEGDEAERNYMDKKILDLQQKMVSLVKEDFYTQAQFVKGCLIWTTKVIKSRELRCISRLLETESHYLYMDNANRFLLTLIYNKALEEEEISARHIRRNEMNRKVGPPSDTYLELISDLFVIDVPECLTDEGPVDVKVVDRDIVDVSKASYGDIYLIASYDRGVTWQRYLSLPSSKESPCIGVKLNTCPSHVIAAKCDPWMAPSESVRDTIEAHVVSDLGAMVTLSQDKRVTFTIEKNSVETSCKMSVMFEDKKPAPIIYIRVSSDVKYPVKMTLPQTEYLKPLPSKKNKPRDFFLRTRDGIGIWERRTTPVRKNNLGHFLFKVDNLRQGVLKTVMVVPEEEQKEERSF
ncbi:polycystin-1-like protein 2 [Argopecten irradians]|uniref:polycystin-1-like protein 2 n=1 Tax=Argopecten irradians TaxID=31199 RepID=UPI0037232F96